MSYSAFGPGASCFSVSGSWTCARFVLTAALSALTAGACAVLLTRKIALRCVSSGLQADAANHHIAIAALCFVLALLNTIRFSFLPVRNAAAQDAYVDHMDKLIYFIRMLIPLALSYYVHRCFVRVLFQRQFRTCLLLVRPLHLLTGLVLTTAFIVSEVHVLPDNKSCRAIAWSLLSGTDFVLCCGFSLATIPVYLLFTDVAQALNSRLIARMKRLFYLIGVCLLSAAVGFAYDLTRLFQSRKSSCAFTSKETSFWVNISLQLLQNFMVIWALLVSFFECSCCAVTVPDSSPSFRPSWSPQRKPLLSQSSSDSRPRSAWALLAQQTPILQPEAESPASLVLSSEGPIPGPYSSLLAGPSLFSHQSADLPGHLPSSNQPPVSRSRLMFSVNDSHG